MPAQTTNPSFPGPSYNKLIDTSDEIVKVPLEGYQWGSRIGSKVLPTGTNPAADTSPNAPGTAPTAKIDHV